MDDKYLTGIDAIDAQHREIDGMGGLIIEALKLDGRWQHLHYIVIRLYELLRFHFAVEESVMCIVGFPDFEEHKRVHKDILQMVDALKVTTLNSTHLIDSDATENQFSFLSHILDHDMKFAEFFLANKDALRHAWRIVE